MSATPKAIVIFDIDGVIRDVGQSYRRALADTVEQFTQQAFRPSQADIDQLKAEGRWNNDWEASQELVYRYFEAQGLSRGQLQLDYDELVRFFQSKYRGENWTGYICDEPLLASATYLNELTAAGCPWGFFSGATRGSATFVLQKRLELENPILVAMEDAPGKPDPTGLFETIRQIEIRYNLPATLPILYAGDTVADMQTIQKAQTVQASAPVSAQERPWLGVGILPPHVHSSPEYAQDYRQTLLQAGAAIVLENVEHLTAEAIANLLAAKP
ncbi:TIGR01548 family HAD-type hydrolase [Leptolyngbya sp. AN02str]|uniref:TIGR01548 family HAD-type hydrolase n=1 Tax=Leptolyngbya sp. AN02str TaxID=3423363 RepID=UPI003D314FF4